MAIRKTIKNILKKGKEGLGIASDFAYEQYRGTIRNITREYGPERTAQLKKEHEQLIKKIEESKMRKGYYSKPKGH